MPAVWMIDTFRDKIPERSLFGRKDIPDILLHLVGVITDGPMYQLVGRNDFQYDADYWFYSDGSDINKEIKAKIDEIKTIAGGKPVFETLFYVINEFKEINPELCKKLCKRYGRNGFHWSP